MGMSTNQMTFLQKNWGRDHSDYDGVMHMSTNQMTYLQKDWERVHRNYDDVMCMSTNHMMACFTVRQAKPHYKRVP